MQIYSNVTDTGIYVAESIKIAEAAKVIENPKGLEHCINE